MNGVVRPQAIPTRMKLRVQRKREGEGGGVPASGSIRVNNGRDYAERGEEILLELFNPSPVLDADAVVLIN